MENEKREILIKKFSFLKVPFNREVRLVILTQKIRLPFNAGKVDVNIKSDGFVFNNVFKDEKISSCVEISAEDALLGLGNGFTLPVTNTFDGTNIKTSISKQVEKLKLQLNTDLKPNEGSISNVFNAEFQGNLLYLAASINGNDLKTSGVRCGAEYKDWTIGAELTMDKITTPNFLLSLTPNLTIETDLSKFNIGYLLTGDKHKFGIRCGFTRNQADHTFGFAAQKNLSCGSDLHVKSDLTGKLDIAHVSKVDFGEFNDVKVTLGGQFNVLDWSAPKFGAGFEFSF